MKLIKSKHSIVIISIMLAVVVGIVCLAFVINNQTVRSFELSEYDAMVEHYNNNFPEEEKAEPKGSIGSAKEAKKAAKAVWKEIYGFSASLKIPYHVFFDEENQVWYICGTWFFAEGGPHILIRKSDGEILAVWHDKF